MARPVTAGLRRLDRDDSRPQRHAAVLGSSPARPTVEIQQVGTPPVVHLDAASATVVEIDRGAPTVVHVVEPVAVEHPGVSLDELTDVDTAGTSARVAYALRRDGDGDGAPWQLVPTVDAQGLLLRVEAGAPGGLAQLDADGRLRADQAPPPPAAGWTHTQQVIASLWQVRHELGFDPAGIYVEDQDGTPVEPDRVTYPIPGQVCEIKFGLPIYGTARLS